MEKRVSKYLAENGPSNAYQMRTELHLDNSPVNKAFNSLESKGLLFRTGKKSEHGAIEFDFTSLGALFVLTRGTFDWQKAYQFWERRTPENERDPIKTLLGAMEKSLGSKEFRRLRKAIFELLLYTHAQGGTDNQILGQLAGFTFDNPTLNILRENPIVQQALKQLQQSYAQPGIMPLDIMYPIWETKQNNPIRGKNWRKSINQFLEMIKLKLRFPKRTNSYNSFEQ